MWIGWLEFDLLLGDVHSLKEKRSVIRPLVAELTRRFAVSAAETGAHRTGRAFALCVCIYIGTAVAFPANAARSSSPSHVTWSAIFNNPNMNAMPKGMAEQRTHGPPRLGPTPLRAHPPL